MYNYTNDEIASAFAGVMLARKGYNRALANVLGKQKYKLNNLDFSLAQYYKKHKKLPESILPNQLKLHRALLEKIINEGREKAMADATFERTDDLQYRNISLSSIDFGLEKR